MDDNNNNNNNNNYSSLNNYNNNNTNEVSLEPSPIMSSPIESFYAKKSVLVTGGTGFIGKVLIEKLLYSCPDIDKIYLLIRGAKGKSAKQRMVEMTESKPFNIRLKHANILDKVVAIESDLSEPNLGLSSEDRELLSNQVDLVFHVAASVKFEATVEFNMKHNVLATKMMLDLACEFKKLQCFVHVSTAYSNCQLHHIEEKIYPMAVPEDPIALKVTDELMDKRPNSYTFTKALAENVVAKYADRLNLAIARPSIVMSSLSEPTHGWVDTVNGPVGLSVLGALGILQNIKFNSEVVFDLIPVDLVSNAIVTIGWACTQKRHEFNNGNIQSKLRNGIDSKAPQSQSQLSQQLPKIPSAIPTCSSTSSMPKPSSSSIISSLSRSQICKPSATASQSEAQAAAASSKTSTPVVADGTVRIFNLTTGSENPCSFYNYFNTGRDEAYKKPSMKAMRPLLQIPKQKGMNSIKYYVHKIFSHLLFAHLADTLLKLLGSKPLVLKAVNRMHHANDVFDYFCSNSWQFEINNVAKLRNLQQDQDSQTFNCDVRQLDWDHYARVGWLGCRRFILKEDDSTVEQARARYKWVCIMYYLVKVFLVFGLTIMIRYFISSPIISTIALTPVYAVVMLL